MGLFRKATLAVVLGIAIRFLWSFWKGPSPSPLIGGHVESGFEAVEKAFRYAIGPNLSTFSRFLAFRKNFERGLESDGAAFAVCHRGKLVVDLWGGYADKASMRPWKEDTITTAFSTTKVSC